MEFNSAFNGLMMLNYHFRFAIRSTRPSACLYLYFARQIKKDARKTNSYEVPSAEATDYSSTVSQFFTYKTYISNKK
jgi:hypothetical protein